MLWWVSSPRPGSSLLVVVGAPEGTVLEGWFADDASTRDLTEFVADLLLEGMLADPGLSAPRVDDPGVPVAQLSLLGAAPEQLHAVLCDPPAAAVRALPPEALLPLLAAGVRAAVLTAAVDVSEPDSGARGSEGGGPADSGSAGPGSAGA